MCHIHCCVRSVRTISLKCTVLPSVLFVPMMCIFAVDLALSMHISLFNFTKFTYITNFKDKGLLCSEIHSYFYFLVISSTLISFTLYSLCICILQLVIQPNQFFENTLNILQHVTRIEQDKLGTPVNKSLWNAVPAVVNAYYSRNKNQISKYTVHSVPLNISEIYSNNLQCSKYTFFQKLIE